MIKSVTVVNHLEERLKMEMGNNYLETGFLISSIDGLGPGDAEISTTELAATDGSVYNSARLSSRNIVLNLIFFETESIEDARQRTYRYFPLKRRIKLIIETDNRELQIDGYVESNEPDIFSEREGTSISIICPNPYFYSTQGSVTIFGGIEPMFEFPFSNESLTEKLLIMSEIRHKYENVLFYTGDVKSGVTIKVQFRGAAKGITLYNVKAREIMRIDTDKLKSIIGSDPQNGDEMIISTITGSKSLTYYRYGKAYNVLNCLDRDSDWITLDIGENILAFTADYGEINLTFEIYSNSLFGGI